MEPTNSATPTITKKQAIHKLWRDGNLSFKLDANQKQLRDLFYNGEYKTQTWLLARRCLAEGTLIKTPKGLIEIQNLKIGDEIYGYNSDGSIGITKVKEVFYNGEKEVVDLINNGRLMATATLDHTWLSQPTFEEKTRELKTSELKRYFPIVRKWIDAPGGDVDEPHAYAIGALLGDGCSRQGVNKIYISSEDEIIPQKIADILKCYFYGNSQINYTWCLSNEKFKPVGYATQGSTKVLCNYYEEWCHGRYAHEKIIDLEIVKKWNRKSQLELLAGLIDTDGYVGINEDCIVIQVAMQSLSVIKAVQYLLYNNFQYLANIGIDNRKKYKNGPVYHIGLKNNLFGKRILKELDPFLVVKRKKWDDSYNSLLVNNSNENRVSVKIKNPHISRVWDIHIDNETNLYLLANGLVTHNCGKSYTLCCLALEICLKKQNSIVKFVSPTKLQVNNIVRPLFRQILEDCPEDIKPTLREKDYIYYFPNGSEIQLAGTDSGHAEKLRGGDSSLVVIDEAGTCADLDYVIKSILLPTTLITKGKILLAGTPPPEPDHEFLNYIEEAEMRGSFVKKTIYDNPRLTSDMIEEIIKEYGGTESLAFRRECLCEIVRSSDTSVIPEATDELLQKITKDWPKPPHFDSYVAMDTGGKDLTGIIFAYYDFRADKIIVQDELVYTEQEMNLENTAKDILKKESDLWLDIYTNEVKTPYLRVSDINYIAINDIRKHSQGRVTFQITRKDDKESAIKDLRVLLNNGKIIFHPRCKTTLRHVKNAKWNKSKKNAEFARSPDDGHYDLLDSLIYLVRNIAYNKNPYPSTYGLDMKDLFIKNPEKYKTGNNNYLKKMFNIKG